LSTVRNSLSALWKSPPRQGEIGPVALKGGILGMLLEAAPAAGGAEPAQERGSMVLTSNLLFTQWAGVLCR